MRHAAALRGAASPAAAAARTPSRQAQRTLPAAQRRAPPAHPRRCVRCVAGAVDAPPVPEAAATARVALLRAVAVTKRGACAHAHVACVRLCLTAPRRMRSTERTDASRRDALAAVAALERCVGIEAPTASPFLDGRWSLVWTCSAADATAPGRNGSGTDDDADALGAAGRVRRSLQVLLRARALHRACALSLGALRA